MAPAPQWVTKDFLHIRQVPIVKRLVEGLCVFKHTSHIRHFGHVPFIERLVEGFCARTIKQSFHIRHVGHIPFFRVISTIRAIPAFAFFLINSLLYRNKKKSYIHLYLLLIRYYRGARGGRRESRLHYRAKS